MHIWHVALLAQLQRRLPIMVRDHRTLHQHPDPQHKMSGLPCILAYRCVLLFGPP